MKGPNIGGMVKTPGERVPPGGVGLSVGPGRTGFTGRFGRLVVKIDGGRVSKGLIVDELVTTVVVIRIGGLAVVIFDVVGRISSAELDV